MLTNLLDSWFKMDVGEGAFYAVFGFIFVFLGIALLILIFTCFGLVMKKINARKKHEKPVVMHHGEKKTAVPAEVKQVEEGLSPALVAVITAAIAAYYEGETQKCDFVVRRIKRL